MLDARKVDTTKVLCWAGSKIFHVLTNGDIIRCWTFQSNRELQFYGNVKDKSSIRLLKNPMPCFAPFCRCQHPTARNAYFEVGDIACHKSI